jgi:hypothetical protein
MAALALAVGVAGGDEVWVQRQGDHSDQGVVHHPIAEGAALTIRGLGSRIEKKRKGPGRR